MLRLRSLVLSGFALSFILAACGGDSGAPSGSTDGGAVEGSPGGGDDAGGTTAPDAGGTTDASTGNDAGGKTDAGGTSDSGTDAGPVSCAPKCAVGAKCAADGDCSSGACDANGTCAADAAHDHKVDKGESDVDCGGHSTDSAPKCALGKICVDSTDCTNNNCGAGLTCSTPGAQDGMQDNGESDVDCGGNTTDGAPKCGAGKKCVLDNDCTSAACSAIDNTCVTGATDGKKDFGESAIDCGGNTTDAAPTCDNGIACVLNNDCTSGYCSAGLLCVANGYTDGKKDFGESDIDCGGHSTDGAPLCGDGLACANAADCTNAFCIPGTQKCATATNNDGYQNGTETDVDCGGGAPTFANPCIPGKKCMVGADCTVGGCNYKGICPTAISCTGQYGGDTCGPAGTPEDCCATIAVDATMPNPVTVGTKSLTAKSIDKYNITAGRMRAFITATNGDIRTWVATHQPTWWSPNWTNWLPNELDSGGTNPDCCGTTVTGDAVCTSAGNIGESCGVYQELGPYVHSTAQGANEGCYVAGYGARSYRLPDATNTAFGDKQLYSINEGDQRSMQCVTSYILAAFCAWDGGFLPTTTQEDHLWHGTTFPWGATNAGATCATDATCTGGTVCRSTKCVVPTNAGGTTIPVQTGAPMGYSVANDTDPQNGVRGTQPTFGTSSYGNYFSNPYGHTAPNWTAVEINDLQWANYNFNYWGGLTQLYTAGNADQTLFIAPPGRFPKGGGFYGHQDLIGNVFNALDMTTAANSGTKWSLGGSWQGHTAPWPSGSRVNVPSYFKYWAMGARCAR